MKRDPRLDPRRGDVLDVADADFGRCKREVVKVWSDPVRVVFCDCDNFTAGPVGLDEWIAENATATIVKTAEEGGMDE